VNVVSTRVFEPESVRVRVGVPTSSHGRNSPPTRTDVGSTRRRSRRTSTRAVIVSPNRMIGGSIVPDARMPVRGSPVPDGRALPGAISADGTVGAELFPPPPTVDARTTTAAVRRAIATSPTTGNV
jgi:hypothetical protein